MVAPNCMEFTSRLAGGLLKLVVSGLDGVGRDGVLEAGAWLWG